MSSFQSQQELLRESTIGRFLREARLHSNYSQAELAKMLSYSSPQFISNWERGLALPPLSIIRKLIKLLQIDKNEFLDHFDKYQEQLLLLKREELEFHLKRSRKRR